MRALEASLRRLQTDHLDLYQLHRPDAETPLEETMRALDDMVSQGKVRYVGSSTFPAWVLMEAIAISSRNGWVPFVTEQSPYNLLDRRIEVDLVPMALREGVGLITWSPLAMGMLAGRYASSDSPPPGSRVARLGGIYAERVTDPAIETARTLGSLARGAGMEPACMALAWLRDRPGVCSVLLGPRTEAQLDAALASLEVEVSRELADRIDGVVPPGTAVTNFLNNPGVRAPAAGA
jgi:aryl-alcohol dehydrogenase-like predicted oxidoreductase